MSARRRLKNHDINNVPKVKNHGINNHDSAVSQLPQLLESHPKKAKKEPLYQSSPELRALVRDLPRFHFGVDCCLFMVGTLYVFLVPYTKSEESFNMQATHDMLFHGYINIDAYDHSQSASTAAPGTFVGSLFLSLMVYPFKFLMQWFCPLIFSCFNIKMHCQHLIRTSLLSINIISLSYFRKSFIDSYIAPMYMKAKKHKDIVNTVELIKTISNLFAILLVAQFHYLFYQSRLLYHSFSLPLVTLSFAFYFRKQYVFALQLLLASTIIFRCDTVLIALPFTVIMLYKAHQDSQYHSMLFQFVENGIIACVVCIALSFWIDSWFWNQYRDLKYPEFMEVLFYELEVLGADCTKPPHTKYDASPWYSYFTTHLAQMLLVNVVFLPWAMFKINPLLCNQLWHQIKHRKLKKNKKNSHKMSIFYDLCVECLDFESIQLALIGIVFVMLYSLVPHKETRFIYFVIPPFTLLSTIGCIRLLTLWGFRDVDWTQITLEYYRKHIHKKQSHFMLMDKTKVNTNDKLCSFSSILTAAICVSICISLLIAVLSVVDKSYTYCGGRAIEKFEVITRFDLARSCYNYNNILYQNVDVKEYDVQCVHISAEAARCGATRFMLPSYCNEFRFAVDEITEEELSKEEYAKIIDPCHLDENICADEDEECNRRKKRGYDYLITKFDDVPGYEVMRRGVVYSKAEGFSIFNHIKQKRRVPFLKPSLYIHKRIPY